MSLDSGICLLLSVCVSITYKLRMKHISNFARFQVLAAETLDSSALSFVTLEITVVVLCANSFYIHKIQILPIKFVF